jgi:hypothetical protein
MTCESRVAKIILLWFQRVIANKTKLPKSYEEIARRSGYSLAHAFPTLVDLETRGALARDPTGAIYPVPSPLDNLQKHLVQREIKVKHCKRCDEVGHSASKCPNKATKKQYCSNCGEPKHNSATCPNQQPVETISRGTGKRFCSICRSAGHRSPYCPKRELNAAGKRRVALEDRVRSEPEPTRFDITIDDQKPVFVKAGKLCGYCIGLPWRRAKPKCKGCLQLFEEEPTEAPEVYRISNLGEAPEY